MVMLPDPTVRYSLPELVDAAGAVLRGMPGLAGASDQRVNPAPDVRTLRYYQSVGLLDRPENAWPRAQYYGYRHLLQVVAIKALQATGASLGQIQTALVGRSVAELEAAIRPALGASTPRPALPAQRPRLVTIELAPGLLLTIDPSQHDVDAVLSSLSPALSHLPSTPGARP